MKALIQRVNFAKVEVENKLVSQIKHGLLTLLGVENNDSEKDLEWTINKILNLRIFAGNDGKFDKSLLQTKGEHLIVSQFTICGDVNKGNRPSFTNAASLNMANEFYEKAIQLSHDMGITTKGGQFRAMMNVTLENDGPVTIWLDSKIKKL